MLQLKTAFTDGYWAARSFEFYEIPLVQNLLWLRLVPDVIFIAAGVLPLVYVAIKSLFHMRKATVKDGEPLEEKKGPQTKESRRLVG